MLVIWLVSDQSGSVAYNSKAAHPISGPVYGLPGQGGKL